MLYSTYEKMSRAEGEMKKKQEDRKSLKLSITLLTYIKHLYQRIIRKHSFTIVELYLYYQSNWESF